MEQFYSSDQRDLLKQFKIRVRELLQPHHEDHLLMKWLIARDFDVGKAEDMFRKSMKWRADQNIDSLLDSYEPPEVLKTYYLGGMCGGYDRDHRPITIDPIGHLDLRGIMKSVSRDQIIRFQVYKLEKTYEIFRQQSAKTGTIVNQCVQILDFEGFGRNLLLKSAINFFTEIMQILDLNYPETLKKTYIINTPSVFPLGFSLMKPFFSEATVNKFVVLGKRWQEQVYSNIDRDQLPVHWGGTMTDPEGDPTCSSKIGKLGQEVPSSYYLKLEKMVPLGSLRSAEIPRKGEALYPFTATKPNQVVRWQFATDDNIHFGVTYEVSPGKDLVIQKTEPMNSHIIPEDGNMLCERPGKYTLVFANPGILSKRRLEYHVEVLDDNVFKDELRLDPRLQKQQVKKVTSDLESMFEEEDERQEITHL